MKLLSDFLSNEGKFPTAPNFVRLQIDMESVNNRFPITLNPQTHRGYKELFKQLDVLHANINVKLVPGDVSGSGNCGYWTMEEELSALDYNTVEPINVRAMVSTFWSQKLRDHNITTSDKRLISSECDGDGRSIQAYVRDVLLEFPEDDNDSRNIANGAMWFQNAAMLAVCTTTKRGLWIVDFSDEILKSDVTPMIHMIQEYRPDPDSNPHLKSPETYLSILRLKHHFVPLWQEPTSDSGQVLSTCKQCRSPMYVPTTTTLSTVTIQCQECTTCQRIPQTPQTAKPSTNPKVVKYEE